MLIIDIMSFDFGKNFCALPVTTLVIQEGTRPGATSRGTDEREICLHPYHPLCLQYRHFRGLKVTINISAPLKKYFVTLSKL